MKNVLILMFILIGFLIVNGCGVSLTAYIEVESIKIGTAYDSNGNLTGEATSFSNIASLEVQATIKGGWHDDPPHLNIYKDEVFSEQYSMNSNGSNILCVTIKSKTFPSNFPAGNYRIEIISEAGAKKGELNFVINSS